PDGGPRTASPRPTTPASSLCMCRATKSLRLASKFSPTVPWPTLPSRKLRSRTSSRPCSTGITEPTMQLSLDHLPILCVVILYFARIREFFVKRNVVTGQVNEKATFLALLLSGSLITVLALVEYL